MLKNVKGHPFLPQTRGTLIESGANTLQPAEGHCTNLMHLPMQGTQSCRRVLATFGEALHNDSCQPERLRHIHAVVTHGNLAVLIMGIGE